MRILLSNDDGVNAKGLCCLHDKLMPIADLTVIAPDRNCSGASNSLTLINPLRATSLDNGFYSVNGTPTDCVHIGINQLMKPEPDLVIAGINHGANLGDDVVYSGTVAAAIEGRFMGRPAIAISLCGEQYFDSAAQVASSILQLLYADSKQKLPIENNQILNVNVPDLPLNEIKGIKITRCGARHRAESMIKTLDPKNKPIYWYGSIGEIADAGEGTDFDAINNGFVSITPLTVDMTAYNSMASLKQWAKLIEV